MKKSIFLLIFSLVSVSYAVAQDIYEFDLKPDELNKQEVILKGPFATNDIELMLGVKWFEIENRIQLVFDRKTMNDNNDYLLLFPLFYQKNNIKNILDCKSQKKLLWTKVKSNELSFMDYFLESDNLQIDDFKNCYKYLAKNNEEEFDFEITGDETEIKITLNGLFALKASKRPWYFFSKRDKRVDFKVSPVTLLLRFPVVEQKGDFCAIAEKVVPYVEAVHEIMLQDYEELLDAQRRQNCTLFGLLKDKIRRTFIETNDKCERYTGCEEIAAVIKAYNDVVESVLTEECKAAVVPAASCSLSESELSAINNRLKNIQMKINVKKKDGNSTAEELKEYQSIISTVNPKLTQECRRRYKNLIDAYSSYCTIIDSLLK